MKSILKRLKTLMGLTLFTSPAGFFMGVGLGFLTCCLAGYWCSGQQVFKDFHRFHTHISPLELYYPTANQMVNLVKSRARKDQIVVVIGGNSILHGFGQGVNTLWSDKLQKVLGDRYHVINLSFEGTSAFEGGNWVTEALSKQGYKVIFVTDVEPLVPISPTGIRLQLEYFQFRVGGFLLDDEIRDQMVEAMTDEGRRLHVEELHEWSISQSIDRLAYSQDLWNWIGYNWFYTIWTDNLKCFVLPKRMYTDDTDMPGQPCAEDLATWAAAYKHQQELCVTKNKTGEWVEIPGSWASLESDIHVLAPPVMRSRSLVLLTRLSPKFTDKYYKPEERRRDTAVYKIAAEKWRLYGYNSAIMGDGFQKSDYIDVNHFAPPASQKMADFVATQVTQLSKRLGYED